MNPLHHPPAEQCQYYFIDVVPHSRAVGLRYVEHEIGRVTYDLPYQADLVGDPATGVMHGGAITTLFDAASGAALLTRLPKLMRIATLDLRIDYLRPAKVGHTVRCIAECYRLTRQVAFTRATAHDGDPADPVASSAGTFMVFDDGQSSHMAAGIGVAP